MYNTEPYDILHFNKKDYVLTLAIAAHINGSLLYF